MMPALGSCAYSRHAHLHRANLDRLGAVKKLVRCHRQAKAAIVLRRDAHFSFAARFGICDRASIAGRTCHVHVHSQVPWPGPSTGGG